MLPNVTLSEAIKILAKNGKQNKERYIDLVNQWHKYAEECDNGILYKLRDSEVIMNFMVK